ncbi:MAG: cellulase family glycosylhydrolase [Ardenticatenales bacterium]|nr:cellulase family glycosylhydrolase [Ardenticatenales bacterium]
MTYRRATLFCLTWLLMVLLVACGGSEEPAAQPTSEPTPIVEAKPTFTPLVEPTAVEVTEPTATAEIAQPEDEGDGEEDPAAGDTERPFASPEYGMQAFMWWRPEVADRDLNLLVDAGFNWVKQDFPWREIEGAQKGHFDFTRTDTIVEMAYDRFGLNILARVDRQPGWATGGRCAEGVAMGPPDDLQDYADFLTALATRYKGKIAAYAIWNEPNLAREWCDEAPSPEEYAELLQVAYDAIKAVDPDAIIISAGLSPTGGPMPVAMEDTEFLDRLYEAAGGSLDGYADVVGAHAPGFKAPPEMSPDEVMEEPEVYGHGRYFTFRRVEELHAVMEEYGDTERQVAILEMGWTTDPRPDSPYNWHAVTEEEKADYLARAFAYAEENWTPWIGLMSVIYLCNTDWSEADEQFYWCLTHPAYPNTVTYPSYEALKAMPKNLD